MDDSNISSNKKQRILVMDNTMNEILFWKVWHNKYLVYVIFQIIENALVNGERKKFKDIISTRWMIENKQFELLKCKLEAGEDNLLVERESLTKLFYMFGEQTKSIPMVKEEELVIQEENEIKIKYLKQSFYQLMKYYYKNHLKKFKLLDILIVSYGNNHYNNHIEEVIEKLYNTKSIAVHSSTIVLAIQNSPVWILEKLLNKFKDVLSDDIKNNTIYWAFSYNSKYSNEIIQFILDNKQLYNIPGGDKQQVIKLDTYEIIRIKSTDIQNKLLDLNYIKLPKDGCFSNQIEIKRKLKEILDRKEQGEKNEITIKNIHKVYSMESKEVYIDYLFKYDEPIKILDN